MANFIKESIAELEHVVWPTHLETKKFFQSVVAIIAAMTLFTYLLTLLFSNALFAARGWINAPQTADLSGSPVIDAQIDATTEAGQTVTVNSETN